MTDADMTEILSIDLITSNPSVRNGRPVIRGTTLEVVEMILAKAQNHLDSKIAQLLAELGKSPLTGREIVEQGLTGGWEDKSITDSVAWLTAQRRKRREKFD